MKIYSQRRVSSLAGFTLIELLVVMAIIAILAGLLLTASSVIIVKKIEARAKGQIAELATAIDRYQAKKGFYPPDRNGIPNPNTLVYELWGAVNTNSGNAFWFDFGQGETISVTALQNNFGAAGIMNSSPDKKEVDNFFANLKLANVRSVTNSAAEPAWVFFSPSKGPNDIKDSNGSLINLVNYVASNPKHNTHTYDLWIDVVIKGKTNRISNWSNEPERGVGPY